jgi:hypothetical protein
MISSGLVVAVSETADFALGHEILLATRLSGYAGRNGGSACPDPLAKKAPRFLIFPGEKLKISVETLTRHLYE